MAVLKTGVSTTPRTVLTLGTTDSTSDILQKYVWIPRYSYTIKSEDGTNYYGRTITELGGYQASQATPGVIDIKFIDINTIENGTAKYTGETVTNYYTHPAFWWDNDSDGIREAGEEISGIWVGKFKTSHTTLSSSTTKNNLSCKNESYTSADGLRILPNVKALKFNNISNFFFASRSMSRTGNLFGFDSSNTDTHMMKNSEWGAMAYLSQSIYGKYGNPNYTEVSTSGNIYGICDMDGTEEYVMVVLGDSNDNPRSGYTNQRGVGYLSGFNGLLFDDTSYISGVKFPEAKYYDLYKEGTDATNTAYRGYALGETSGWYAADSRFVDIIDPWFSRTGSENKGLFAFSYKLGGDIVTDFAYVRLVLTPVM